LEGEIADIGATRIAPATSGPHCPHKGEAKSSTRRDRCMTIIETAQRTREFFGFARNFANDRDGYRVVKKADARNTFPRGIFRKTTMGGVRSRAVARTALVEISIRDRSE
jgi:hypothetical protein